jgi:hypothetical protein
MTAMEQSGNMYLLSKDEYVSAKKLVAPGKPLQDVHVDGPCIIRHEATGNEPGVGTVLSVQIGFSRGREYLVAKLIKDVVFSRE